MNQSCAPNYWQDASWLRPKQIGDITPEHVCVVTSFLPGNPPQIVQLPALCNDKAAIVLSVNEEIELCCYGRLDVTDAQRCFCPPWIVSPILDFSVFMFPIGSKTRAISVVFTALNFTTFQKHFFKHKGCYSVCVGVSPSLWQKHITRGCLQIFVVVIYLFSLTSELGI